MLRTTDLLGRQYFRNVVMSEAKNLLRVGLKGGMVKNLVLLVSVIILTLPNFAHARGNDSTSGDQRSQFPALNRYHDMEIYRRADIIYFYDQLKEDLTFNWGPAGVEERFPVIAVTPGGKSCHYLSQRNCTRLPIPRGSVVIETFSYGGSDISGIHHYEGSLKLVSPDGKVIRTRKTYCNTLPSSTTNVGCPFDRGIDI